MSAIRLATSNDIAQIMHLVQCVTQLLNQQGNFQWDENYPLQAIFEQDIGQQTLFVAQHAQQIKGIVCINTQQAQEYLTLDWQADNNNFYVIHRLAVHPLHQNSGIGSKLLAFADNYAHLNNKQYIQLDTYKGNETANRLFKKHAYQSRGNIQYEGYSGFYCCYEKKVEGTKK